MTTTSFVILARRGLTLLSKRTQTIVTDTPVSGHVKERS